MSSLGRAVDSIVGSLGSLRDELSRAGQTNWQAIMAAGALFMAVISACLVPTWMLASQSLEKAGEALQWQHDYQRGLIPSSADAKLAAIDKMFIEIETQFHAFKERMIENEGIMNTRADFNLRHIEEDTARLNHLSEELAWIKGKDGR